MHHRPTDPTQAQVQTRRRPALTLLALVALALAWLGPQAKAEEVGISLPSGIVAQARLQRGTPDRPAVLILHGFLQTHEFPTVRRLGDALAEDGYTVLTPNLSLDIDGRSQSLACEAIHTHTMEGETAELWAWIDWLGGQTQAPILVIGHSIGGVQVLAQTATRPHPRTRGIILISLAYFGPGPVNLESAADLARAEADLAQGRTDPQVYALSFCQRYPTLPAAYLSYVHWGAERSQEAIAGLAGTPLALVLGTGDSRLDWDWVARLEATGTRIRRVEGANHFFDQAHEFDLWDAVGDSLSLLGLEP
jgi:dienelactone hydrolase